MGFLEVVLYGQPQISPKVRNVLKSGIKVKFQICWLFLRVNDEVNARGVPHPLHKGAFCLVEPTCSHTLSWLRVCSGSR